MSLNWACFQPAFQLQKTPNQPDILELIFSKLLIQPQDSCFLFPRAQIRYKNVLSELNPLLPYLGI